MIIKKLVLGALATNCYLVYDQKSKEGIIVDPADEANFISEQLLRQQIKPVALVATHAHFDHLLAAWELQLAFNLPLLLHPRDLFLAKKMSSSASWWLGKKIIEKPPQRIEPLKSKIIFGQTGLRVIVTPGHTPGSVCFYSPPHLFTGDTLFAQGVGRSDFSYSSPQDLQNSLRKLSRLPPQTTIYPGHGQITTLDKTPLFSC